MKSDSNTGRINANHGFYEHSNLASWLPDGTYRSSDGTIGTPVTIPSLAEGSEDYIYSRNWRPGDKYTLPDGTIGTVVELTPRSENISGEQAGATGSLGQDAIYAAGVVIETAGETNG